LRDGRSRRSKLGAPFRSFGISLEIPPVIVQVAQQLPGFSANHKGQNSASLGGTQMKRRDFLKLGVAGIAATRAGIGLSGPAAAQTKMVLKATDVHPLGYPTVEAVVRMGKKLETATNGRLSVQMYPSMQLGGEKEMIEQAQVGALVHDYASEAQIRCQMRAY
jgi:hypothetical protein